jgi:hypothetical protein
MVDSISTFSNPRLIKETEAKSILEQLLQESLEI